MTRLYPAARGSDLPEHPKVMPQGICVLCRIMTLSWMRQICSRRRAQLGTPLFEDWAFTDPCGRTCQEGLPAFIQHNHKHTLLY